MGSEILDRMELYGVFYPFDRYPSEMNSWPRCTKCGRFKDMRWNSHCSMCVLDDLLAAFNRDLLSKRAKMMVNHKLLREKVFVIKPPKDELEVLLKDIEQKFWTDEVSIDELVSMSPEHQRAFSEAMKKTKVRYQITPEELGRCLRAVGRPSTDVTYTDSDLPPGSSGHTNALYITVGYMGQHISKALVDTGAGVNVMTMKTARNLGIKDEQIRHTTFFAMGFNGSVEPAKGFVDLEVSVGNVPCKVGFYLMDIESDNNLILGRPFIHGLRAVPSSLHQKLRFPFGGAVVTVNGEPYY